MSRAAAPRRRLRGSGRPAHRRGSPRDRTGCRHPSTTAKPRSFPSAPTHAHGGPTGELAPPSAALPHADPLCYTVKRRAWPGRPGTPPSASSPGRPGSRPLHMEGVDSWTPVRATLPGAPRIFFRVIRELWSASRPAPLVAASTVAFAHPEVTAGPLRTRRRDRPHTGHRSRARHRSSSRRSPRSCPRRSARPSPTT